VQIFIATSYLCSKQLTFRLQITEQLVIELTHLQTFRKPDTRMCALNCWWLHDTWLSKQIGPPPGTIPQRRANVTHTARNAIAIVHALLHFIDDQLHVLLQIICDCWLPVIPCTENVPAMVPCIHGKLDLVPIIRLFTSTHARKVFIINPHLLVHLFTLWT